MLRIPNARQGFVFRYVMEYMMQEIPFNLYVLNYTTYFERNLKPKIVSKDFVRVKKFKGQIISKANYGILNSSKKRTNKFNFTTKILQVDLFSFVFWRKLKTPKRRFEIN